MVLERVWFEKICPTWKEMQSFFYFSLFFWRSFSLEYFSGKSVEIWAKFVRTPKNLPAPTRLLRPTWHVIFQMFSFVISVFCLLFGWMLFLSELLSSLWIYFFLVRYTLVLIWETLFSQLTVCAVEHRIYSIISRGL